VTEPPPGRSAGSSSSDRPADDSVGLLGAIAIGIGGMVGGGIFAVLGVAAERAGGATPVAFAIAGAVAGLTAYSYTTLSVHLPSDGGTVNFVDRIFGIGALTGTANVVLWVGYVATTALYAAAFGHYGAALLPGDAETSSVWFRVLAVVGVGLPWFVNLTSAGLVARTESVVVGVKMLVLLVVVAAGVPNADPGSLAPSTWGSPVDVVAAGMLVFVAYEGFELIANASADVARPAHTLPRAYGWSVGLVVALYVLVAGVVVASLSAEEIAAAADYALAEAASTTLGRSGFVLVGVAAVLATFSAINATLYGAARLSAKLALEGELPDGFRRHPWDQPIGLHVTALLGLAIAVGLPLSSISSVSSSIFLIVFTIVNAAAWQAGDRARVRRPVAGAGVAGCAASLVVLTVRNVAADPTSLVVLAVLLGVALVGELALLRPRRARRP
jgi:amino acid transporter